jgi:dolichol-phosphate mannosyltransferase
MQEPTELILEMVRSWENGNNVVLAVRDGRDESKGQAFFANFYYKLVQKTALPQMPDQGFDVYLVDRKVINVLDSLDEKNSALTGQILWSGFRTGKVYYRRLAREIGTSRWTLKKKIGLVKDTLFSFTSLPIAVVLGVGVCSMFIALVWAISVLISKLSGTINVSGWTTLFIFNLFSFGVTMMTLGILGEYLWRTFDASRNRPPYIIEDEYEKESDSIH